MPEEHSLSVRRVMPSDAERLAEIYAYYVEKTAITFEIKAPDAPEFGRRIGKITEKYPYLVIERDGAVRGYAYADRLSAREAYAHSCEVSIYTEHGFSHRGLGRALYTALEKALADAGITNLYACIAQAREKDDEYADTNSVDFHEHMGYRRVGHFNACGCKFGRLYDIVWMEKIIGAHGEELFSKSGIK